MNNHTPGPWQLGSGYTMVCRVSDMYEIADCGMPGISPAERIGNARLVAAAPDLLAALKLAKTEIDSCAERNWHGAAEDPGKNYRTICAAIAKAEGGCE